MKNLFLLILILGQSEFSAQNLFNERYRFGFKLGYSIHTITGGRAPTGPKLYGEGGMWLRLKMDKKWTCQAELLFVEKGTGGVRGNRPHIGDYWVGLYYLEVTLLFQYHKNKCMFEFGPGLGYLVYGHEILHLSHEPDLTNIYPFTNELSFNAGFHYSMGLKWDLGLRCTQSLLPVRKQLPGISTPVYNRLLALVFTRRLMFRKQKAEQEEI